MHHPENRSALRIPSRALIATLGATLGAALLSAGLASAYTPGPRIPAAGTEGPRITEADLKAMARNLAAVRAPSLRAASAGAPTAGTAAPAPAASPSLTKFLRNRQGLAPFSPLLVPGRTSAPVPEPAWLAQNGTPIFVDGRALRAPEASGNPGIAGISGISGLSAVPGLRALAYFQANKDLLKLKDPASELRYLEQNTDELGFRHEVFQQQWQGVPVWNGRIHAHFDRSGGLYALNARFSPTPAPVGAWRLDGKAAADRALADLSAQGPIEDFDAETRALLDYAGPVAERNVWIPEEGGAAHWAWRVEIRPNLVSLWRYFIDGATGAILEKYDAANSDGPKTATANDLFGTPRTINTYQVGSTYYLIDGTRKSFQSGTGLPNNPRGALQTLNANKTDLTRLAQFTSTSNNWTDQAGVSAHFNTATVYEYYLNTHGRNGIDGAGGTMIAAVHVTQGGAAMDNAYWNGRMMAYGDGSRVFKPLARALDVTAHEMTHGIIAATVNLDYKNQAGALNESLADVFGCMVDRDDWKMGEDIINALSSYPSGALRNLQDPHNGGSSKSSASWQPAHMTEYVKTTGDNGGVHINCGIPNHAAYQIANVIGREKLEKIYYRVLSSKYINPGAQFIDMRLGAVRAATDLYGETSPEVAAVKDGFSKVGVGSASTTDNPTPRPPDRPASTGTQYVALLQAKPGDSTLYRAKPVMAGDTDLVRLSATQVFTGSSRPISVSGDGSLILFIDKARALRAIDGAGERVLSAGPWKSVAVSPDGLKAAVTAFTPDGKIHILDVARPEQSRAINLYTPTPGQPTGANTVSYADAIEFSPSGESIVYDCLNSVPQDQGSPIEFWDVDIVEVATGLITPFLPILPEGVNVGNPSFSQTSDVNVAFDLIDESTGSFSVIAADLFTGVFRAVDSNSTIAGGPRYSTRDDKIVFTRKVGTALNVYQIPMQKDRITPAGRATSFLANAQKPVWFAKGPRPVGIGSKPAPAPSAFGLSQDAGGLRLELPSAAEVTVTVYDAQGRLKAELARGRREAGFHRIGWEAKAGTGMYLVRMAARPDAGPARTSSQWVVK